MAKKVTHSPKFDLVKSYYDRGLWSADRVRKAVGHWITAEEAAEILRDKVEGLSPMEKVEKRIVRTRLIIRGTTR